MPTTTHCGTPLLAKPSLPRQLGQLHRRQPRPHAARPAKSASGPDPGRAGASKRIPPSFPLLGGGLLPAPACPLGLLNHSGRYDVPFLLSHPSVLIPVDRLPFALHWSRRCARAPAWALPFYLSPQPSTISCVLFFLDTLFLYTYPDSVRNKIPFSSN